MTTFYQYGVSYYFYFILSFKTLTLHSTLVARKLDRGGKRARNGGGGRGFVLHGAGPPGGGGAEPSEGAVPSGGAGK